jgi:hypothetical protein
MRLVVLVPFESSMNPVEEPRLPRSELVFPTVSSGIEKPFFQVEELLVLVQILGSLFPVHSFCRKIGVRRCIGGFRDIGSFRRSGYEGVRGNQVTSVILEKYISIDIRCANESGRQNQHSLML